MGNGGTYCVLDLSCHVPRVLCRGYFRSLSLIPLLRGSF